MPYLNVPFGTYAHSPQLVIGKDGALYTTGIGDMGKKRLWRGRVWRFMPQGSAEMIFEAPGHHVALHVVGDKLFCAWIDVKGKVGYDFIPGYVPLDAELPINIVNVNEAQLGQLKLQLSQAQENVGRTQRTSENLAVKVDQLTAKIRELEKRPAAQSSGSGLSRQQIEDIVWSKVWDVLYILRMGMINGSSDPNVQGFVNDLRTALDKE